VYIKSLEIADYRNYARARVDFCEGLNVLLGGNAQGKTNLLEAVCLSSVGRSPRTPRDKELINWRASRAKVKIEVQKRAGSETVELIIDRTQNKSVLVNGMPISRMGELMGVLSSVFFLPDEIKIVGGGPGERRAFMDIALCQMSRSYFYLLQRYNKTLSQRNRLLKSGGFTADALDVWDAQLVDSGAKIIKTRKGYLERLGGYAAKNHEFLTGGAETLDLTYEGVGGAELSEIAEAFAADLKRGRERDIALGYTHPGPQKDDVCIKIGQTDARSYGSQGQKRTAALAVKLAELDLNAAEKDDMPVLLLDDVLSELDVPRRQKLLQRTAGVQTVLTCTHIDDSFKDLSGYKIFSVSGGRVE
jgi:DNA replication and repair protein RecF